MKALICAYWDGLKTEEQIKHRIRAYISECMYETIFNKRLFGLSPKVQVGIDARLN